ncbi:hypothetical protein DINM_004904 [Dirofilaria immitis]|nr:hypothetical protein [Dirofilaria immitis]
MSYASIYQLFSLLSLSIAFEVINNHQQSVLGTKCLPNQYGVQLITTIENFNDLCIVIKHKKTKVVTKLTVYENGAVEAECNKLPCGTSGIRCTDNQVSCRAETDTFSSMKWASNGQSILQSCCSLSVPRKIYIGTDLVSLGSYYTGGMVDQRDLYSKDGLEFDFVSNVRTEQGGIRVWVYRVICPKASGSISGQLTESNYKQEMATMQKYVVPQYRYLPTLPASAALSLRAAQLVAQGVTTAYKPINPLQYRPTNWNLQQRDSPIATNSGNLLERLL